MQKRKQLERKQEKRRPQRGSECFDNERIPLRPVVAVSGEQADALAVPPSHEPISVMLDFVNPRRTAGRLRAGAGQARKDEAKRERTPPTLGMGAS